MAAPQAYPLQWPAGKPRTPADARKGGAFGQSQTVRYGEGDAAGSYTRKGELTIAKAIARLQGECDRLEAALPVISSNVETRLDGMPRSDRRAPEDPGVALYFQLRGKPIVLACDRYTKVASNIAAIAAHIAAIRTAERHGVGSLVEMFKGFEALPPPPENWRGYLGWPTTLEQAEANYRERMKYAHPDVEGGHETVAAILNDAIAKAREAFA